MLDTHPQPRDHRLCARWLCVAAACRLRRVCRRGRRVRSCVRAPLTAGAVAAGLMSGLVPGALIGARIAHSVPLKRLKLAVSVILVAAAIFLIGKLVWVEVRG